MRKTGLDLLRALAIILVLFRHSDLENNIMVHVGWLGVDLFFVLSGFLVASLLFAEYQKHQTVDLKRFLIRRAFKIFPPFYFYILLTVGYDYYIADVSYSRTQLFAELLYVQNYVQGIWFHTWSLDVEEHFYLLLVFAMMVVKKMDWITNRRLVISFLILLLVFSFCMRLNVSYPHRQEDIFYFMRTHLRADGIILGVLLAYLYHFTDFIPIVLKRRALIVFSSIVLIAPAFYFEGGSFFMNVIGLTTTNLGFALIVLLSLDLDEYIQLPLLQRLHWPIRLLCFVGVNSYSIYLWHLNSMRIIYAYFDCSVEIMTTLYVVLSLIIGVLMSYLVEKNALKVRDSKWMKTSSMF